MVDEKKPSPEVEAQRMTLSDVETIRVAAAQNEDCYMLALAYIMKEVICIRELLKQQNQASDSGSDGTDCSNYGKA